MLHAAAGSLGLTLQVFPMDGARIKKVPQRQI
jgi:hypothetical protein